MKVSTLPPKSVSFHIQCAGLQINTTTYSMSLSSHYNHHCIIAVTHLLFKKIHCFQMKTHSEWPLPTQQLMLPDCERFRWISLCSRRCIIFKDRPRSCYISTELGRLCPPQLLCLLCLSVQLLCEREEMLFHCRPQKSHSSWRSCISFYFILDFIIDFP